MNTLTQILFSAFTCGKIDPLEAICNSDGIMAIHAFLIFLFLCFERSDPTDITPYYPLMKG